MRGFLNRLILMSLVLVFPFAANQSKQSRKATKQVNRRPSLVSFTSSKATLALCPFSHYADKPEVTLVVSATDPDGDSLTYEYSTTDGTISAKGPTAVWNLSNLLRGPYGVRVKVKDGRGGEDDADLTVTTVDYGACDPPPPPCP